MSFSQQINVLTLGVKDLEQSKAFYSRLGWTPAKDEETYAAYQAGGLVVFLYPQENMPEELRGHPAPGRTYMAINLASEADVDRHFKIALAAGATEVRPPESQFWGGYSGVFADPDGHYWEVAFNPAWIAGDDGILRI